MTEAKHLSGGFLWQSEMAALISFLSPAVLYQNKLEKRFFSLTKEKLNTLFLLVELTPTPMGWQGANYSPSRVFCNLLQSGSLVSQAKHFCMVPTLNAAGPQRTQLLALHETKVVRTVALANSSSTRALAFSFSGQFYSPQLLPDSPGGILTSAC